MEKMILSSYSASELQDLIREVVQDELKEKDNSSTKSGVEEFLTVKEVAEKLKVSQQAIYEHIERGTLEKKKFGRRTLITVKSVNAAVREFVPRINKGLRLCLIILS